ncbi:MAG: PRC-barrel domain-containing protein [Hyphomicrobiaceae bacterium]|nr:PRC-barrel domain-containing protein [Hyphomicrobiaceae bacterium]
MKNIYPIAIAVTMASTPVWAQTAAQQPQAAPAPTATEAPATRAAIPSDATAPSAITPPKSTTMELDRSKPMLTDEEAKAWVDKVVYSSDDKNLGEVADFKRDAAGHVTELHADIGGFLGLGETRVRVAPDQFKLSGDRVVLSVNAEQAKSLPKVVQ